jgi:N-acetylglucosamine kinase-like BadF-type ATPase
VSLYIGIEGVALTHSGAVAAREDGTVLSSCRLSAQPISLHMIKRNVFRSRLFKLIKSVAQNADATLNDLKDATICVGLSGVTFPYDAQEDFPREFRQLQVDVEKDVICTGDAEISFAAAAQSMAGSAIVCGMGSTALVADGGKFVRYGGWGPWIGDEGSGYWIGIQALRALGEQHDKGQALSTLWHAIDAWLSDSKDEEFPDLTAASLLWRRLRARYSTKSQSWDPRTALFEFSSTIQTGTWEWRPVVSSLASPVIEAHSQGDRTATAILNNAARHLTSQYRGACVRAQVKPVHSPLVLTGGVLSRNRAFRSILLSHLRGTSESPFEPILSSTPSRMRPAFGALLFALGNSRTGDLRLPPEAVIERVIATKDAADLGEGLSQ